MPASDLLAGYTTQSGLATAYRYEPKRDLKLGVAIVGELAGRTQDRRLKVEWLPAGGASLQETDCVASSLRSSRQVMGDDVALAGNTLYYGVSMSGKLGIARHALP